MTEFLRLSGIYWGVTALDLMDNADKVDQDEIVEYIKKCQCPVSGGISPCEGHDPHILYTLSAVQVNHANISQSGAISWRPIFLESRDFPLESREYEGFSPDFTAIYSYCSNYGQKNGFFFSVQILCIYDRLEEVDVEAVAKYVSGLQQPDGSFFGDKWGEVDTRFSFCAVAILSLIVS